MQQNEMFNINLSISDLQIMFNALENKVNNLKSIINAQIATQTAARNQEEQLQLRKGAGDE